MNQIKVLIVVAVMCVAALSQSAPPLPPVPTPPPVPSDSGASVPAAPAADAPAADAPAVPAAPAADAPAAPAGSTDGPGICWTCGLGSPSSCTYESFTVPDGEDAAGYQKGSSDVTRPCNFCIVQKSEDPDLNIKLLYRGCNDYDPTNGGEKPSYTYDQDGVTYTVTTKVCKTALCNQN